ncbi:fimbria/pilus periplasmic chaperone [Stenotrophomonas indicatrix]|uniref:fimbria/pilus periplasmic chaperone n=1 Tax=Stenotrophomonas indicatrix TaxID=2045451 RepID=UPI0015DE412D|nr:fimbria/pilus periplasmic chaperone [Stenotrophomonas indicatrix]MBA0098756.1 fimbria/pilus periplasmic chaperone [Stenotrophomonas indicatrix]
MKMMIRIGLSGLAVASSLLSSVSADARVIVHGTRQIFPGGQQEITVRTENVGQQASLIQAWVDDGDKNASPETVQTPFMLRPPIYRLDAGKSQAMRVAFSGGELPQDRESIYWLNILDIPSSPEAGSIPTGNYIQFSLRTRIKLIYRPKGLNSPAVAPQNLQWSVVEHGGQWRLQVNNPTPYYVHFSALALRAQGKEFPAADFPMVAPMSDQSYILEGLQGPISGGNVLFQYINDQGGIAARSAPIAGT